VDGAENHYVDLHELVSRGLEKSSKILWARRDRPGGESGGATTFPTSAMAVLTYDDGRLVNLGVS